MYWPVGTPRIYEIAELHSRTRPLKTNTCEEKFPSEGLSTSENENSGKAPDVDPQSSIVCKYSSEDTTSIYQ